MLEDLWLHTFYEDPKAVTDTVEDDDFNEDDVAEMMRKPTGPMPTDFEDLK
jgi:hypothetical protein